MSRTIAAALAAACLPPTEARVLLRQVMKVNDAYLIAHASDVLTPAHSADYAALAARRHGGEPIAYIVGEREFFSLEFKVTPAVLIPRPQTELLVEFALEHIGADRTCAVLDLGTGSGCVAVCIARYRPQAQMTAIDASVAALEVARGNAGRHGVRIEFMLSDWLGALAGRCYDLIVANPPYVAAGDPHLAQGDLRFEPASALAAGHDGLDCLRLIIRAAPQYLKQGGWLSVEHGYDQAERCRALLSAAGFKQIHTRADLEGTERVSAGLWPPRP